jgi:hypothetical protein
MRPPILQWKVSLALLAVVFVAVTLGSVLRPSSKPTTITISAPPGGWTSYTPTPIPVAHLPKKAFFVLAPERKTPLDRLRAWLDGTFNK